MISIAVPIPRAPVEGLYCSLVLDTLRVVEIPDEPVTNPIKAEVDVVSLTTVNPPLLLP
jgi:hypothetical protein